MIEPNFILLYVDSPARSAEFYTSLLGYPPIETSPTFAMFALPNGFMLGLWSKHTVEPGALATGRGGEIAFAVETNAVVEETFETWKSQGLEIIQPLTNLDFGFTFVATDPDGHRLRVFCPTP